MTREGRIDEFLETVPNDLHDWFQMGHTQGEHPGTGFADASLFAVPGW